MKRIPILLFFFFVFCLYACNQESVEDLVPETEETSNNDPSSDETSDDEVIPELPENVITTPCDFNLSNVAANSTIVLNCVLDLNGATITLPSNVKFDFEGGDIVGGGKLVFSGGTIDGRLLSSDLTLEGDVTLKDSSFKFYASRWDIVEGITTSDIALQNTAKLENLMFQVKELGATTFIINNFDAYFEVTKITPPNVHVFKASKEAINVPSDFHLKMTNKTHLRTFPAEAGVENGAIISIEDVSNVMVSGGTLHGDRDQRVYSSSDNGLEGSHLFYINSGRNVTLDGITFINGSKGALSIMSKGFSYNPDTYKPTTGATIKNCTFKNSRRMGIALTDGRDIYIENNTFINSGQPSSNSDGGEVGYAINIEPARRRDENGELQEQQKVFDVFIRNNTETNSRGGFVTVTIGQDITIDDNEIDTRIVYSLTSGTRIINNQFTASAKSSESFAIFAAGVGETVFNNEVSGNHISGYSLGISVGSREAHINNNTIVNCENGIQLSKPYDAVIENNKITVSGRGITGTNTFASNTQINNNEINASGFHLYFVQLNNKDGQENYQVNVENNKFVTNSKKVVFSNINGVNFKNNQVIGGLEIGNSSNITVSENTFKPDESDGIRLYSTNLDVSILENTISEPTGAARYVCINDDSNASSVITNSGNTCN
ncbi:right-handed parallel beta-helix repeat-containing protein [Aquimarina sp. 2201CG1-2-11]|uniref:right-handed parallel beta-helix repeat-containing protein n=1 Tax=Aquimarina discodermiae TaxID=3231043 RepID=UPI0034623F8C